MSSRQAALSVTCPIPATNLSTDKIADAQISSLYRRSLKLALDWSVHRNLWRGQAMYIRSLFENNRNVTDPRLQRVRNIFPRWMTGNNVDRRLMQ